MAKTKKTDDEVLNEEIARDGSPEHFKPMEEMTQAPARPKATDPAHLKPMEEVPLKEVKRPDVKDPKHLKPQE